MSSETMGVMEVKPNQVGIGLDVVLPTHNNLERTMRCVRYLYGNTKTPFHLIVVDDSTDGLTPTYFEQLQKEYSNITFIHSNKAYIDGNTVFNIGFKNAKTSFVATVMNSVSVEPDWELVPLQLLRENKNVGMIGMKCLFPNGLIESAGIKMAKYLPCDMGRDQPSHRLSGVYECDAAQWAFALLRREAGQDMEEGVFNGFKGWDDIDNCFVLKKRGWRILYCGLGVGYHEPRATRGDDSKEAAELNRQNGERFYKRWGFWEDFLKDHPEANADVHAAPKEITICG